jgi:tRNA threonylcarbamoyl adenosine modification protein YeaZ
MNRRRTAAPRGGSNAPQPAANGAAAAAEAEGGAAATDGAARRGGRRELVLALDAGSPWVSAAVGDGGTVVAARALPQERSSTQLLTLAAEALAEAGARPTDLAGIVALAGPGSFTGLRVGLATALGLHQALGIPARTVPTLAVMAAAAAVAAAGLPVGTPAGSLVIAAVDALRGEWSAQLFRAGAALPLPLGEMALLPAAELLGLLPAPDGAGPPLAIRDIPETLHNPEILEIPEDQGIQGMPGSAEFPQIPRTREKAETRQAPAIIAFNVAALRAALGAVARVRWTEAPPLAPAALRLAAAAPLSTWRAATLAAPIYSRPPAATLPRVVAR